MHFYREANCELILKAATTIDRAAKTVALRDGRTLVYDKLLLATGARVRRFRSRAPISPASIICAELPMWTPAGPFESARARSRRRRLYRA